jgi:hypothetical protein
MSGAPESHWSLDKRVPLALILALVTQTGGAVWWASAQSSRLDSAETRISAIEAVKVDTRLVRLEEAMANLKPQLDRIETKLDRLTGYPAKP